VTNGAGASISSVNEHGINALNGAANVTNSGTIASTNSAGITGGSATVTNNVGGRITGLNGIDIAHNVTVINSGTITGTASLGAGIDGFDVGSVTVTNNSGASITGVRYGISAFSGGSSVTNAGSISGGTAAIDFAGTGNTLTLLPGSTISGAVLGRGSDTLQLAGTGAATFDASQLGASQQYRGSGTLNKLGSSVWTLTGTSPFAGQVYVDGGTLAVNGDMTATSGFTVNATGTLAGTGKVGATQVNAGAIFAPSSGTPGSSMTVLGSLAFQSGAIYLVQVNPATASSANVTGTATLGGAAANAVLASGSYVSKQYTILTGGAVNGTFSLVVNTNLPSNFSDSLSYDATHAYLNLRLNFGIPGSLNSNQQAVGNALTNFFNTTGGIPMTYAALSSAQLSQASGELGTGAQQTTFQAMGQFLSLLTDPFMGRGGGINGATAPTGYADE
jgi:autotransporter-associated beta strand protein